jgi:hypothetical protein
MFSSSKSEAWMRKFGSITNQVGVECRMVDFRERQVVRDDRLSQLLVASTTMEPHRGAVFPVVAKCRSDHRTRSRRRLKTCWPLLTVSQARIRGVDLQGTKKMPTSYGR